MENRLFVMCLLPCCSLLLLTIGSMNCGRQEQPTSRQKTETAILLHYVIGLDDLFEKSMERSP